MKNEQIDSGRQ